MYYGQQVRRTPGISPKAESPQRRHWGSFKLRVRAYSGRGLSRGLFSIESGQRLAESRLGLTEVRRDIIIPHPPPGWGP